MGLKTDYNIILQSIEQLDIDTKGRLPIKKSILAVLISIDKHLKAIEGKL